MEKPDLRFTNNFICFAHRGANGHEPENTLLSIEKAIALGAKWIEIDVHAVENELVVIHDERLERTTNGAGLVAEHSLQYLQSLDAGKGQHIPLLREVFNLIDRRAGINIELKSKNTAVLLASMIDEYVRSRDWTYDRILVSSYDHQELKTLKSLQPKIKIGALIETPSPQVFQLAQEMGAHSVHVGMERVDKALVKAAHRMGLSVYVFTVNMRKDIKRMREIGADGIFTDYPEIV